MADCFAPSLIEELNNAMWLLSFEGEGQGGLKRPFDGPWEMPPGAKGHVRSRG